MSKLLKSFRASLLTRCVFLAAALLVMLLGLGSRIYREQLPTFLAEYAGDALWAMMVFLGISFLVPQASLQSRVASALLFSFLIELSQLYHAPWIDSLRETKLGALILGFKFVWTDLICYTVGIFVGAASECTFVASMSSWRRKPLE